MAQKIEVFRMGSAWCIQVDDKQALISANSSEEAKGIAERLVMWQPDGPPDPFVNIQWQLLSPNRYRMVITEG